MDSLPSEREMEKWTVDEVTNWLQMIRLSKRCVHECDRRKVNGQLLLGSIIYVNRAGRKGVQAGRKTSMQPAIIDKLPHGDVKYLMACMKIIKGKSSQAPFLTRRQQSEPWSPNAHTYYDDPGFDDDEFSDLDDELNCSSPSNDACREGASEYELASAPTLTELDVLPSPPLMTPLHLAPAPTGGKAGKKKKKPLAKRQFRPPPPIPTSVNADETSSTITKSPSIPSISSSIDEMPDGVSQADYSKGWCDDVREDPIGCVYECIDISDEEFTQRPADVLQRMRDESNDAQNTAPSASETCHRVAPPSSRLSVPPAPDNVIQSRPLPDRPVLAAVPRRQDDRQLCVGASTLHAVRLRPVGAPMATRPTPPTATRPSPLPPLPATRAGLTSAALNARVSLPGSPSSHQVAAPGGVTTTTTTSQPEESDTSGHSSSSSRNSSGGVIGEPWYFHGIGKVDVRQKLYALGRNGAFLVRDSSNPDPHISHTLCVLYKENISYLHIRCRPDARYAFGTFKEEEEAFVSITKMIEYYQTAFFHLCETGMRKGAKVTLTIYPAH